MINEFARFFSALCFPGFCRSPNYNKRPFLVIKFCDIFIHELLEVSMKPICPDKKRCFVAVAAVCFFFHLTFTLYGEEFPLRAQYPDVKTISTSELSNQFDKYTIIDVRSQFEYEVIHIKNSIHAAIAKSTFSKILATAVKANKNRLIAFYCNGVTCAKSYKAARKANEIGYTSVKTYDAGIFNWTKKRPDKSVLLGESPVELDSLIAAEDFKSRLLSAGQFGDKCREKNALLFDIREPIQRVKNPDFGINAKKFDMNKFVSNLRNPRFRKRFEGRTILFFDAVGKQVRWLQYYLEKNGIQDYYFLKNGAWSIFGATGATK